MCIFQEEIKIIEDKKIEINPQKRIIAVVFVDTFRKVPIMSYNYKIAILQIGIFGTKKKGTNDNLRNIKRRCWYNF